MKRAFSVGDRVRAYHSGVTHKGTVDTVEDLVRVEADLIHGGGKPSHYWYHPKQLRHLKPKKREEAFRRIERYVAMSDGCDISSLKAFSDFQSAKEMSEKDGWSKVAHLIEVCKGERILSKEEVLNAWHSSVEKFPMTYSSGFHEAFLKALGFQK